jgi:hypothetical protein
MDIPTFKRISCAEWVIVKTTSPAFNKQQYDEHLLRIILMQFPRILVCQWAVVVDLQLLARLLFSSKSSYPKNHVELVGSPQPHNTLSYPPGFWQ